MRALSSPLQALPWQALVLASYLVIARAMRRSPQGFAATNLLACLLLFSVLGLPQIPPMAWLIYVAAVTLLYLPLAYFGQRKDRGAWIAFLAPLALLLLLKLWPTDPGHGPLSLAFIGASYMAFRLSYLVLEVRNGITPMPGLWSYLGFAFFLPTLVTGPISSYASFLRDPDPRESDAAPWPAMLRIVVGASKFFFLGTLAQQISYERLLALGRPYPLWEFTLAVTAYPLYLYWNFSGFCDMAIGVAALIGVPVTENFDAPFTARNVKEFWNRWHITLSQYTRDMIFFPLSKALISRRPSAANHAIAASILCVFLVIGVWHGLGWHFLGFGAAHAAGVIANHYYTLWLKRRLGAARMRRYNQSPTIRRAAVVATFAYVAATFFLFANDFTQARRLLQGIRG